MSGRKPTHRLKAYNPSTKRSTNAGVGWLNENGSVSISIDDGVVLGIHRDLIINLWPINEKDKHRDDDATRDDGAGTEAFG